jgi:hypothetical protein
MSIVNIDQEGVNKYNHPHSLLTLDGADLILCVVSTEKSKPYNIKNILASGKL